LEGGGKRKVAYRTGGKNLGKKREARPLGLQKSPRRDWEGIGRAKLLQTSGKRGRGGERKEKDNYMA